MIEANLKGCLKGIVLELRRQLEGYHDAQGNWQAGDLERRLAAIGVRRDRSPVPADGLTHLSREDREGRRVVDAFLKARAEAGVDRGAAILDLVAKSAYTWANRLLALRCMEARSLIDEVILQKNVYGGRSLQHNRLARKEPGRCTGEDEGLFAVLFDEFERRAKELPLLFNPKAPEVALWPSVAVLKHCIALLSGTQAIKGQEAATDEIFTAPDALGWAYQYWNAEEKDRVFEKVRTKKGAKIEGAEIIPATCIYTEPYIVKFLVQNSLGAMWAGMYPESRLPEKWEYFVRNADRAPVQKKSVREITFLDPACGSGHFLLEAFNLFYNMYQEEGQITDPAEICAAILERNLYGIDIDERAVQIAALALVMKAKEKASKFVPRKVNLVATNIRLPAGKDHLEAFLQKHPDDAVLKQALLTIFDGLAHADELGSLLQFQEPVERELKTIREKLGSQLTLSGPKTEEEWAAWKIGVIERLHQHFEAEVQTPDLATALFGEAGAKGLSLVELLARRYDVVAANPPYMGWRTMGSLLQKHLKAHFPDSHPDLCTAFLDLSVRLLKERGVAAFVMQKTVMFNSTLADLRQKLLRETGIEVVAHLGTRAFTEITGAKVDTVMLCLRRRVGTEGPVTSSFLRPTGSSSTEKAASLRALAGGEGRRYRVAQELFSRIAGAPFAYRLTKGEQQLLRDGVPGRTVFKVYAGISTANNPRFIRYSWEVPQGLLGRWKPCNEGGVSHRWVTDVPLRIDWEYEAARIRGYDGSALRNLDVVGQPALTFSRMSGRDLGVRMLTEGYISLDTGRTIHPLPHSSLDLYTLVVLLNSRYVRRMLRVLNDAFGATSGDLERLPLPELRVEYRQQLGEIARQLVLLTKLTLRWKLASDHYEPLKGSLTAGRGLRALGGGLLAERFVAEALVVAWSDKANRIIEGNLFYSSQELQELESDGWRLAPQWEPPLVDDATTSVIGFVTRPNVTTERIDERRVAEVVTEWLSGGTGEGRVSGAQICDSVEDSGAAETSETQENEGGAVIHPESVLGRICVTKGVDSLTLVSGIVPYLLESAAPRLLAEPVADYFGTLALQLLGHRWPSEVCANKPMFLWADSDGIIPLTEGAGEPTLLARVRERIAADFGANRASAIEREFEEVIGKPLSLWLVSDFFRRHISQFSKRPIAWQITSSPGTNERRRGRAAGRSVPVFSCLIYYHRLDGDLLPKLRSQYVGPLRVRFQTELAGLEKLEKRTADQDERRVLLEGLLEELKDFDGRLEQLNTGGFSSDALSRLTAKEPLDKWTSGDGQAPYPTTREAFQAQERKYDPDLNDGVRVNVAPLQKAGVLAADVLAAKDVEKAIADRVEWRADERRWCREGKLPHPGWWPSTEGAKSAPKNSLKALR